MAKNIFKEEYSSNTGIILKIKHNGGERVKALMESTELFAYKNYNNSHHKNSVVGYFNHGDKNFKNCLDMPLRLSGETDYKLPEEWLELKVFLEKIIGIEHHHNPNWRDYNCYLTVHNTPVRVGEQQRNGGAHSDGFQGERIKIKTKINRSYVYSTNGGTIIYPNNFIVVDPKYFNVFEGFDLQISKYGLPPIVCEDNSINFMNAYTVHESGLAVRSGMRLFIRLSFDVKEFDRYGNTINKMLDYDWDMVERNAQETVATPSWEDVMESPHK